MKANKRFSKLRSKHQHAEEGEGNWLISYADMMTLLWGFFVILNAYSVPSKGMMEKIKESTSKAMGGEYKKPFSELSDELSKVLTELNLGKEAQIETLADGVKVTLKSGNVFESGSSAIPENAKVILSKLGVILKKQDRDFRILIEGHTDDVPMKNIGIPSNWELSSNRASNVVRFFEEMGVRHESLRPIGFSDVEPLVDVKSLKPDELSAARAQNRRIVIRLQKNVESRLKGIKD